MTRRGQYTLDDLEAAVRTLRNAHVAPIKYHHFQWYFIEYRTNGFFPFRHLLKKRKVTVPGKRWFRAHFKRLSYEGSQIVLVRSNFGERKKK